MYQRSLATRIIIVTIKKRRMHHPEFTNNFTAKCFVQKRKHLHVNANIAAEKFVSLHEVFGFKYGYKSWSTWFSLYMRIQLLISSYLEAKNSYICHVDAVPVIMYISGVLCN